MISFEYKLIIPEWFLVTLAVVSGYVIFITLLGLFFKGSKETFRRPNS